MATKKNVARTQPPAKSSPASTLRSAKARIKEASKVKVPTMPVGEHPATAAAAEAGKARREVGDLSVPITLSEICSVVGVDCHPERFAVTALECLAGQLGAMVSVAERENVDPYDAYRVMDNIAERMRLASRVTAWLESEEAMDSLPVVQP
jgi:hypothetical protein